MIVSVVATRDLQPGTALRRYKADAPPDDPRRGNSNNRYTVVGLVVALGVWKLVLCAGVFLLA